MLGIITWSIVISLNFQDSYVNTPISSFQKSYEAMLAGKWSLAKELLAEMKRSNTKIDSSSLSRLVELSQSSIYNANVLTGLRLFKEYGVDFQKGDGHLLTIAAVHDKWGQVTERLLQYGADPNKPWVNYANNRMAFTPLAYAAMGPISFISLKIIVSSELFVMTGGSL